jgi:hypothetical protein
VTCNIVGTSKTITRTDVEPCDQGFLCQVAVDKQVSGDGGANFFQNGAVGWNAFDSDGNGSLDMPAEAVAFRFVAANTGNVPVTCTLFDEHTGVTLPVPLPAGGVIGPGASTGPLVLNDVCRAQVEGVDTARLTCACGGGLGNREVIDQSDLECRTPALTLVKECQNDGVSGDDAVALTVTNPGTAALVNCQVTDTLDLNQPPGAVCPGNGAPLQPVAVVPANFPLAANGGSQAVAGSFADLMLPACNVASVTCQVAGTAKTISRSAQDECAGGVCEVKVDKQVSCDSEPFVDIGFDDGVVISCVAPLWADIDVRYVVRNTGNIPIFACSVTDSNPGILAGPLNAGNLVPDQQTTLDDANQQCSEELAADEPDTATVLCDCAAPGSGVQVTNTDTARFECEDKEGVCIP